MAGSLKLDLNNLGWWLVHRNLISTVLVDETETWSRPPRSMAGSHLTWSRAHLLIGIYWNLISTALVHGWFTDTWSQQPWLMAGLLKLDLNFCWWVVHWNSISTTFVDDWFTDIWSPPPLLMTGSLKFDLDHLGRWLAHWNLISAVLVDCWFTLNLIWTTFVDGWLT